MCWVRDDCGPNELSIADIGYEKVAVRNVPDGFCIAGLHERAQDVRRKEVEASVEVGDYIGENPGTDRVSNTRV